MFIRRKPINQFVILTDNKKLKIIPCGGELYAGVEESTCSGGSGVGGGNQVWRQRRRLFRRRQRNSTGGRRYGRERFGESERVKEWEKSEETVEYQRKDRRETKRCGGRTECGVFRRGRMISRGGADGMGVRDLGKVREWESVRKVKRFEVSKKRSERQKETKLVMWKVREYWKTKRKLRRQFKFSMKISFSFATKKHGCLYPFSDL